MSKGSQWDIHTTDNQELLENIGIHITSVFSLAYLDEWEKYKKEQNKEEEKQT